MALYCSISHEVPDKPVVSPSSNCVFERRLIEKFIAENGCDPINGEPLTIDMLVEIKTNPSIKPKPPSATSIPAILKSLQDEWDAVMLHTFTLRQQLQTARQELSHSLYQHDAACRVIARLSKEAAAAREALATLKPQTASLPQAAPSAAPPVATVQPLSSAAEVDEALTEVGMSEEVTRQLQDKATVLTAERKKRGKAIPDGLVSAEAIKHFRQVSSHAGLHSASQPGILALDIHLSDTSKVLTGGLDKNAVVFNRETEQVIAVLKGHTKKVTHAVYHPYEDLAYTGSPDRTIRVWSINSESCSLVIRAHDAAITGMSLHATGDFVLSCADDRSWAFTDVATGQVLSRVRDTASSNAPLTCAQFHPDGLIFGTGTGDAMIKIWDLKEQDNVANFPGHSGPIADIAFSENGYYLATAADDSVVKLWDLRKLRNFKTIQLDGSYEVRSLQFDQSGSYLAVAGSDVRVYMCKQWVDLKVFDDHTAMTTAVGFGHNATYIASTSMDRTIKFYAQM